LAISLTINNKTFEIPTPGEDPGWGGDTTDWIKEANKIIASLFGPGDILRSSFNIADIAVDQTVLGLAFDPLSIRGAIIEYTVYRESDSTPSGNSETGVIHVNYDDSAATKWTMTQDLMGDANITFEIDSTTGQIKYTTTTIGAAGYSGVMKFRARALSQ